MGTDIPPRGRGLGKHTLHYGVGVDGGWHMCAGTWAVSLLVILSVLAGEALWLEITPLSCEWHSFLQSFHVAGVLNGSQNICPLSTIYQLPPLACRASEFRLKVSYFMRQYSKTQAEQPLSFNSWLMNEPAVSLRASAGLFSLGYPHFSSSLLYCF